MHEQKRDTRVQCRETGLLVFRDYCYALQRRDGSRYWLEMDRIPLHLIDQQVRVEGRFYGHDLVSVDRIGPI